MIDTSFELRAFDDYHSIINYDGNLKALEIGCFPVSERGYCQYFGCFYKGKKPSLKNIYNRLIGKIVVGDFFHKETGENIGFSPEGVRRELKNNGFR